MSFDLSAYNELFREEAVGYLERLSQGLLRLEQSPGDADLLNELFRAAHSLKGTALMMARGEVADVAHGLEDLLDGLRAQRFAVTPDLTDALLAGVDALERMTRGLGTDESSEISAEGAVALLAAARAAAESEGSPPRMARPEAGDAPPASVVLAAAGRVAVSEDRLDRMLRLAAQSLAASATQGDLVVELRRLGAQLAVAQAAVGSADGEDGRRILEARLEADRLLRRWTEAARAQASLAEDLYFETSQARMVPIDTLFRAFQRPARDAERSVGKSVRLVLEGGETAVDRRLLDDLHDPLLHLVRNGIDHGVEAPAVREALGKPPRGTIRLSARAQGERVLIEVSDDGAGLDSDAFRRVAVSRLLLTEAGAAALSDSEALALMFRPGFSTRIEVSEFAGRGVGMDVVKTSVDAMRGQIRITTEKGRGTTFTLSLPLTVAAARVLLVRTAVGGQPFAIPIGAVDHCEWVAEPAQVVRNGHPGVLADGVWRPLRSLSELLGGPPSLSGPAVIVRDGDTTAALVVDVLEGEATVVVEPLGPLLRELRSVTGGAILPNGQIVLLLSVPFLLWGERVPSRVLRPRL